MERPRRPQVDRLLRVNWNVIDEVAASDEANFADNLSCGALKSELLGSEAWAIAAKTPRCRVCNNLDPRAHPQSRVVRSPLSQQLLSFLEINCLQMFWAFVHKRGNKTCGYCDVLVRATFELMLLRQSTRFSGGLEYGSLTLVEGQPALLSLDVHPSCGRDSVGIEIFKSAGEDAVPGLSALGSASSIAENAADRRCMDFLSSCLRQCIDSHDRCRNLVAPLPKRVLMFWKEDAAPNGDSEPMFLVKLHISRPFETGLYAALSHCWGTDPILTSRKQNIPTLQDRVEWNSIPKTFQDAIMVSHRLGIQYLWVDSLCIIQDDKDDWKTEAPKMGDIYRNAYVTIAASSSSSGSQRFLQNRSPFHELVAVKFYGPHKASLGRRLLGNIGIRKPALLLAKLTSRTASNEQLIAGWSKTSPWNTHIPGPLSTRGWTLQERVLSARTVHFSDEGIIWECLQEARREDGRSPEPSLTRKWEDFVPVTSLSGQEALIMRKKLQIWWHELLTEYTRRNLTYRSDILHALSGIAKRMHTLIQSPYLAGLWKDRFVENVCWRPAISSVLLDKVPPLPNEDAIPGMPTWSCFSICHPISFAVVDHAGAFAPHCRLLSSDFPCRHRQNRADFSSLSGRLVVLEGPVVEMELIYPPVWKAAIAFHGSLQSKTGNYRALMLSDAPVVEDTALTAVGKSIHTVRRAREGDGPENIRSSHDVLALDVGRWTPSPTPFALEGVEHHFVLILAPSTNVPGCYERIGMTDSGMSVLHKMFQDATVQRIQIV